MIELPRNTILPGDALTRLADLPTASIDCVVFSPPYLLARDYGVVGQLGMESNVREWVAALREVMREVARVLKPAGGVWLNVADVYSKHARFGAPPKSAVLAPERLLIGLLDDGWSVRSKAIWLKTNAMPTAARDRLANSYEFIYFLTRQASYYFDLDAIRVPHRSSSGRPGRRPPTTPPPWAGPLAGTQAGLYRKRLNGMPGDPLGRNPGDCWPMATAGFRGAHFAVFPMDLVVRPILASCPERVCTQCERPWRRGRVVAGVVAPRRANATRAIVMKMGRGPLRQDCSCEATSRPGVVLDPFMGSGTTAVVAQRLGRDWIGIELNREFCALAAARIDQEKVH